MSERPTMSDGSPFDPTDSVHVAERLSVVATERDRLAARLADVEAERDEAVKLAYERIEKQNVETGKRVDLIHEREAFRAERDRLAQELEDALGHLRAVLDAWDPMAENYEMGPFFEAREFLARFPVKEGDGNG